MSIHIMLDLETMGNKPNAAITAIGAVAYDTEECEYLKGFYSLVSLESSVKNGQDIDPDTVIWWLNQSDDARSMYNRENQTKATCIKTALQHFNDYYSYLNPCKNDIYVWGNGVGFDNVILRNAYDKVDEIDCPFPFWSDRCYRTLKNLYPYVELERQGTLHNALDDAKTQMDHLIKIFKEVGINE